MSQAQGVNLLAESTAKLINENGLKYQKNAVTELRVPNETEIGSALTTFVKDGDSLRIEATNVIKQFSIHARNPDVIGHDEHGNNVYNEWLIDSDVAIKNYGLDAIKSLSDDFSPHKKSATLYAVKLDQNLINSLQAGTGQTDPSQLMIKVDWSDEPMVAKIGDYITSGGYSISAHDMGAYSVVDAPEIPSPKKTHETEIGLTL